MFIEFLFGASVENGDQHVSDYKYEGCGFSWALTGDPVPISLFSPTKGKLQVKTSIKLGSQ